MTAPLDEYFDNCLFFSVSRLQRQLSQWATEAFAETGLAPNQAFILMLLAEHDHLQPRDIAQHTGLAPSTITRFLDKLEKRGLCQRLQHGRTVHVAITADGRQSLPQIHQGWKTLFATYNAAYGTDDAATLNDKIVSLSKNISEDK